MLHERTFPLLSKLMPGTTTWTPVVESVAVLDLSTPLIVYPFITVVGATHCNNVTATAQRGTFVTFGGWFLRGTELMFTQRPWWSSM